MSDFFKSAMGYFNTTPNISGNGSGTGANNGTMVGGSGSNPLDNDYVGQIVDISGHKLRVKRVIAEGGFAFVYVAQDVQSSKEYALKRLLGADKHSCTTIINEINTHKELSGHPNVVTFVAATFIDNAASRTQQRAEYLLLSELCKGGSLIDCLKASALEPALILRVFYQACRAVSHMHSQMPPIIHRDIKIENFLIGNDKQIKLCDFGSATREIITPTPDWNAHQRNLMEDQQNSVTTPMYRAPEMLDTWSNHEIGPKVDIWALGCILYVLCFQKHPFDDSAKLRIINGNYVLPSDSRYTCFHEIIKGCLTVIPAKRFDISMVLERLASLAETQNWSLKGPVDLHGKSIETSPTTERPPNGVFTPSSTQNSGPMEASAGGSGNGQSIFYTDDPTAPCSNSTNPSLASTQPATVSGANNSSLFSSLRGGAGSFLKNLKDTSTKVMQTMQQTIARTDLDISYITSRVLVMPCPSEGFESAYKTNNIEDVRLSIESRFALQKVSIYNFGPRTVPRLPPPVRTVEVGTIYNCSQSHAPNLQGLFSVAEDMFNFLNADTKSIVIIQTGDSGGCAAATVVCSLLMYAGLLNEPEDAIQVFAVKRHPINLRPSEFRYLYYFGDILRPTPLLPHYKNINLVSLSCQPVPRMTKARDGCRIYMEVYCNERMLLTTVQDYEKMRLFIVGTGKIVLPINLTVCGDLTIVLYHARNALKGMVRPQGLKICQFQINTGFVPEPETLITFKSQDLDDLPDPEQVPPDFTVSLSLIVTDHESPPSRNPPWLPSKPKRDPHNLFISQLEYEEMQDNFVTKPTGKHVTNPSAPPTRPPPPIQKPSRPSSPLVMPDVTEIAHEVPVFASEPSPPIDLLNLNQPAPAHNAQPANPLASAMPSTDASFDLLGAFGDDDSTGIGTASIPDILPPNIPQPTLTADLDDIFGSLDTNTTKLNMDFGAFTTATSPQQDSQPTANIPMAGGQTFLPPFVGSVPTFVTTQPNSTNSKEPSPQQAKDPFADLANLASGLNINFDPNSLSTKSTGNTPVGTSPHSTHYSSPIHNTSTGTAATAGISSATGMRAPPMTQQAPHTRSPQNGANYTMPAGGNATQNMPRPDYSRVHFDNQTKGAGGQQTTTSGQGKNADIFGDILGAQGYKFGSKTNHGPRSINEMRKEELIKDMDPDKVRIMEWTDGKKNNIRALLCSMHTVLWDNAKWTKCEMSTLVTPAEVKKAYRRACLAVHPDKHNGTDKEEHAKLVFMELNNAWTDFENDATQQNMFKA